MTRNMKPPCWPYFCTISAMVPFLMHWKSIIVKNSQHETLSLIFFDELNKQFHGQLSLARDRFLWEVMKENFSTNWFPANWI
jgi:hypothetical protein